MSTQPRIEFWYEFASTYSYPAAMRITDRAAARGVAVAWRPFLLGPIAGTHMGWTDSVFNTVPVKGRYMWRDLERLCTREGLVFNRPPAFPRNGLLAARIARLGEDEPWIDAYTRAVYEANFALGLDIADPAVQQRILTTLHLDADTLLAAANADDNKARLKQRTQEAFDKDLFGAPSFVVGHELFWGFDRLDDALAWATR